MLNLHPGFFVRSCQDDGPRCSYAPLQHYLTLGLGGELTRPVRHGPSTSVGPYTSHRSLLYAVQSEGALQCWPLAHPTLGTFGFGASRRTGYSEVEVVIHCAQSRAPSSRPCIMDTARLLERVHRSLVQVIPKRPATRPMEAESAPWRISARAQD